MAAVNAALPKGGQPRVEQGVGLFLGALRQACQDSFRCTARELGEAS